MAAGLAAPAASAGNICDVYYDQVRGVALQFISAADIPDDAMMESYVAQIDKLRARLKAEGHSCRYKALDANIISNLVKRVWRPLHPSAGPKWGQ